MRQKLLLGCGGLAALVLAFGFGLYFSWCWGWWGKGSLFMRYLFQCNCPAVSEKERYAPYTVLVSACDRPSLRDISSNGRYVLFRLVKFNTLWRYDTLNGQYQSLGEINGQVNFMTDDQIVAMTSDQAEVFSISRGMRTPVKMIDAYRYDALTQEHLDILQSAEEAFVVKPGYGYTSIVLFGFDTEGVMKPLLMIRVGSAEILNRLVGLLMTAGVRYVTRSDPSLTSPDGKLYADSFGLYESGTGRHILETWQPIQWRQTAYNFAPKGWVNGGRAVVYGTGRYDYAFKTDVFGHYLPVPLPILLLEVPPEYWPTP